MRIAGSQRLSIESLDERSGTGKHTAPGSNLWRNRNEVDTLLPLTEIGV
jgi:hypothetical protein